MYWIEDGLARSVRAGVPQGDCGNADLLSPEQDEPLLINFRQPVNGFATDGRVLRRGNAFCDRSANRAVHLPIAATQLLDRANAWKDQSVLGTFARAFAVNGLRAGNDDLFNRKIFLPNHFKHLCRAERIHVHIFRDLRHVTAVRGLVKNNVDPIERSSNRIAIPHVALDEFRLGIYPCRLSAAVGLRLEIIQRANLPTFAHEKIDNVRADQTRGASDECAFFHSIDDCHLRSRLRQPRGLPASTLAA